MVCARLSSIVILENFQPSRDIGGVFFARLLLKFEIGTQESRSQLGNELLAAVAFIAPALAAEVTVNFCFSLPDRTPSQNGGPALD
jgi:hypothetical protein